MEKSRGQSFSKHDTSEDILHRLSPGTDRQAAAELREIYLRARYDDAREIDRTQVDRAKTALRKCRTRTGLPPQHAPSALLKEGVNAHR